MTPTEQDKKLHSKSYKLAQEYLSTDNLEWFVDLIQNNLTLDEALQLITADRKRLALEARINERNKIALDNYRGKTVSESTNWQAMFEYFMESNERRITKLKAQQEQLAELIENRENE